MSGCIHRVVPDIQSSNLWASLRSSFNAVCSVYTAGTDSDDIVSRDLPWVSATHHRIVDPSSSFDSFDARSGDLFPRLVTRTRVVVIRCLKGRRE